MKYNIQVHVWNVRGENVDGVDMVVSAESDVDTNDARVAVIRAAETWVRKAKMLNFRDYGGYAVHVQALA